MEVFRWATYSATEGIGAFVNKHRCSLKQGSHATLLPPTVPSPHSNQLASGVADVLARASQSPPTDAKALQDMMRQYRPALSEPLNGLTGAVSVIDDGQFWSTTMPKIVRTAASYSEMFKHPLPVLHPQQRDFVALNRNQVACLLANMVLCTFATKGDSAEEHRAITDMPYPVFDRLLTANPEGVQHKLACILHLFQRINTDHAQRGSVVFRRTVLPPPPDVDFWLSHTAPLMPITLVRTGGIEDSHDCIQVDFANKFLGGGVLGRGLVQEEILMSVNPELIVGLLLFPRLHENEAIVITGTKRFSDYTGYGRSFRYGGDYTDTTPISRTPRSSAVPGTTLKRIICIDALHFPSKNSVEECTTATLLREVNKAYCGFAVDVPECSVKDIDTIATGNWGCGVFNGNPVIKAILQWCAASAGRRRLRYHTFGDEALHGHFNFFMHRCIENRVSVGAMFDALLSVMGDPTVPADIPPEALVGELEARLLATK